MRFSRPCYDKYQRCPGWAGGAMNYAKNKLCEDGSVIVNHNRKFWKFKFHKCNECKVIVFPFYIRKLDIQYAYQNVWRFYYNYTYMRKKR